MTRFPKLTTGLALRFLAALLLPWLPAYLFESLTFWVGIIGGPWYGIFTGWRLPVDIASFALGGILLAYIIKPRWAILSSALGSIVLWILFYSACLTFTSKGLLHSECYQTGPDALSGLRLSLEMFCFGAVVPLAKLASQWESIGSRTRPLFAILGGFSITAVMVWFPMSAWFSGVTYLPPLPLFQGLVILGVPLMVTGMMIARIARSVPFAMLGGTLSMLILSGSFWTLPCPGCERDWLAVLVPLWALFAFLGGLMELGFSSSFRWARLVPNRIGHMDVERVATALVIALAVWTLLANSYWEPSVLYTDTSGGPGNTTIGLPMFPYIAGYYNSTQYRICCLELGVSFAKADLSSLDPGNFLMAGMGVQSPNCCIDGWDLGWRADAFILPNGTIVVSGSTWGTCDSNASCGGMFWQYLRYHAQVELHPANISSPIFLRMMWEPSASDPSQEQVNWYYNTSGMPWQRFGSFVPDFREGKYFDIGVVNTGNGNLPERHAYFFQFGVASKVITSGWSALIIDPSFRYQGSWRLMERANVIQGYSSFWKGAYRWAGLPYPGVSVIGNIQDPSMNPGLAEFSFTGNTMPNHAPIW